MSETPAETPTRAAARYVDEDAGEVSLPGYVNAIPSIVSPGDVFTYDAAFAGDLDPDRFVEVDVDEASRSPYDRQTKAELGQLLGVDPDAYSKGDLVSLADDRARMFPPVPGAAGSPLEDEVPIPGQDVHDPDAPVVVDPDAVDDGNDTPEGEIQ
jgi:hypothetical protein